MATNSVEVNFIGGAYEDDSTDVNAQQCINLYVDADNEGGFIALMGTPGTKEYQEYS